MTAGEVNRLAGPLSHSVATMCQQLLPHVSPDTASGFVQVLRRLNSPLQLAVAGRIKSGKSTLVNALIGRRIAPTAVGECTRLVTRFQYGTVDRVELILKNGQSRTLPFNANGMIPEEFGFTLSQISHVEVYLTNAVLQYLTVIDTPGLGSLDSSSVSRTEELLSSGRRGSSNADSTQENQPLVLDDTSRSAVMGAEAVLYVLTQSVRTDDQNALALFAAATGGREAGPVNTLAVLNKADTITPDSVVQKEKQASGESNSTDRNDPVWTAAQAVAAKQAAQLQPRVADVLPMIGLLAETVESGGFTSADAEALKQLAVLPDDVRDTMLVSVDLFLNWDCEVPEVTRLRLLEILDLYGVRRAIMAIRREPMITAGSLRRILLTDSGLPELRNKIHSVFAIRADGIKAAAALASITALARNSGHPAERQRVQDAIEALLMKPEAHQLRLLEGLTAVVSGAVDMPPDLIDEILRVGSNTDVRLQLGMPQGSPRELATYALERAGWWRSFATFGATPSQSRVAHVVHRAYFLIWQQFQLR